MKGFFVFLAFSFALIAGFVWYYMQHPTDTQYVRKGAHWVIEPVEKNVDEGKR
ncbi:hypothetical protein [Hydrogenimonas sp.]